MQSSPSQVVSIISAAPPSSRRRWAALAVRLRGRFDDSALTRSDRAFLMVVVVGAGWALWVNLLHLGRPPLAADELEYANAGWFALHPHDLALKPFANPEHPPLAKLMFGFAQLFVGHPSWVADRVVAVLCTLGAAILLAVWIGHIVGRWVGLGVGLGLVVIPMRVGGLDYRFGRYGMLDPIAELFMLASVVLAWAWFRREGRAAWWWAIATGVTVGMAAGAKENGFLGAVGPVLLGVALAAGSARRVMRRATQAAVAAAVAAAMFAITYLPGGRPLSMIHAMLIFQSRHSRGGHFVVVAGRVTVHQPAWAFYWFAWHGMGAAVSVVMVCGVIAALVFRHDMLVAWCVAALVAPIVFHTLIAGVILSYYWVMWMPAFLALAGIGAAEILSRRPRQRYSTATLAKLTAIGAVLVVMVVSVHDTIRITAAHLAGPADLPTVMRHNNLHGPTLIGGFSAQDFVGIGLPGGPPLSPPLPAMAGIDTVVLAAPACGESVGRYMRALVAANVTNGTLRLVYHDRRMAVYAASRTLSAPTSEQVNVLPRISRFAYC